MVEGVEEGTRELAGTPLASEVVMGSGLKVRGWGEDGGAEGLAEGGDDGAESSGDVKNEELGDSSGFGGTNVIRSPRKSTRRFHCATAAGVGESGALGVEGGEQGVNLGLVKKVSVSGQPRGYRLTDPGKGTVVAGAVEEDVPSVGSGVGASADGAEFEFSEECGIRASAEGGGGYVRPFHRESESVLLGIFACVAKRLGEESASLGSRVGEKFPCDRGGVEGVLRGLLESVEEGEVEVLEREVSN